ncbi:MAG: hypothetical protein J07HQW2_03457 [Haloquadratum walsbyi J07HQW2]|uniref:Uncharacterized protein n=1 Tax=Haloquadratum walsbyi J07HQW2 TaxID=1238425 RepID=U1PX01_9EURY|nr:MAG: hypothetical protein J07HQW2_03457 [Haloquadratum walsbyi J07HQW2]
MLPRRTACGLTLSGHPEAAEYPCAASQVSGSRQSIGQSSEYTQGRVYA